MASSEVDLGDRAGARFAWLTLLLAAWNVGSVFLVLWATLHGLSSGPGGVYDVPFYVGLVLLSGFCVTLVVRAKQLGRRWRLAFPPGYGPLGAGTIVLLVGLVGDVGWREGVGIAPFGIEGLFAPTRVLVVVGLVMVAVGPLRAALGTTEASVPRWPAVLSAALILAVMALPGLAELLGRPQNDRAFGASG